MAFMSRKVRSPEEIKAILKAFEGGMSQPEISKKFALSEAGFYRILRVSRGETPEASPRNSRVEQLEKKLKQRDLEIALLKAALKKT